MKIMHYIGIDSHDRPVYEDENGKLWKDTDPRPYMSPSLCSALDNQFDGEPDCPFHGEVNYCQCV